MNARIHRQPFEVIDRGEPISFKFEGRPYDGFRGDVLASALWASGVRLTGRSFKYHRPRGCYSFAGHDANAIFTDGVHTNLRGDLTPLAPGLNLSAVNTFGGLRHDLLRMVEWFSPMLPVGFYYKTFHKPRWLFPFHERQMRRVAGLGRINADFPPTASPKNYDWCDLLVVGSGAAGLSAAHSAALAGLDVLLIDEAARLGGSLVWQQGLDSEAAAFVREKEAALRALPNVRIRTGTTACGHFADNWIALFDEVRLTKLRAGAVIYANGTIEQPAVFPHNDLPGVMLASGAQRLIRLYAVRPFDCALVYTANQDGYTAALDLIDAGVDVPALVDLRPEGEDPYLAAQVTGRGIEIHRGFMVHEVMPNRRRNGVGAVVICPVGPGGEPNLAHGHTLRCDGLAVSVGWMPNITVPSQAGVRFAYDEIRHQLVPVGVPPGVYVAGRLNGLYTLASQISDGCHVATDAAQFLGRSVPSVPMAKRPRETARSHPYPIFEHQSPKSFIDFDEDLRAIDIINAHQEGYDSVELLKRYSTVGMGPSQGKLANMNAIRLLTVLNHRTINGTGTTTARPYYQPVPIGHLAGRRFHPMRHTPLHDWHRAQGAVFFHAGEWYRPEYYARPNETRAACIVSEARQVRQGLGLIDLGTLGKIFAHGPDATAFLERIYISRFAKLAVGRSRYGIAVDESGIVFEDGVIARLAEDRFYITTTSSGAGAMYREMLRWSLIWGMKVTLVNATSQYTAMNLAGRSSREVLQTLVDTDLAAEAFPYQAVRECRTGDIPLLLLRVGFVGELGYEIHVPAWHAAHVWERIFEAGQRFGIRPFGVEAQRLLRLEKGHFIITHDTDALTNPYEAGLGPLIGKNKPFFVGQRSLQILAEQPRQRQLVGIRWADGYRGPLPDECHLIIHEGRIAGRVTSIAPQSTVGYPLGLAFAIPELAPPDTPVKIRLTNGSFSEARTAKLPFYDPENLRQKST